MIQAQQASDSSITNSRKMKLCSFNVFVSLLAAVMSGKAVHCDPISPTKSLSVEAEDLNEVAINALCPFTIKPMYIWIPKLNTEIRIINITCKNSFIR